MIYPLPLIVIFLILVCAYLEYNKKMTMNNKVIVCVVCILTLVLAFTFVDKYKSEEENFENINEPRFEIDDTLEQVVESEEKIDILNEFYKSIKNPPPELKKCSNIIINGPKTPEDYKKLNECRNLLKNKYINDDPKKKELLEIFNYNSIVDICRHIDELLITYEKNIKNHSIACVDSEDIEGCQPRPVRESQCEESHKPQSSQLLTSLPYADSAGTTTRPTPRNIGSNIQSSSPSSSSSSNSNNNPDMSNSNNINRIKRTRSKLLEEAREAQNSVSIKENESLLHNFYDKLNYRKPGYSYIDPKYWSVPQKRPPVCVTNNEFNPASLYDRGTPTNVLELTPAGDIAATEENVRLTNVGSILPKFEYTEII
jgi:hypothetical protein